MDKADAGGQAETAHITILRPDDWHLHLRDGGLLSGVLPESIRHFARALVMPNLQPPVVTARDALNYRKRIESALPPESGFSPLMTLYLTESTDPEDVAAAHGDGVITAVKLYPAGATTHSESGVREVHRVMPVLERMAGIGCPLCVHGEVPDSDVDVFDRESVFIENVLDPLRREIPDLRIVLEHVTTAEGVDYVGGGGDSLAATITVHHLLINRNHILAGGIRPHYYCLPVAKRERHRLALREAAVSGHPRFFLGTDSAPHCVADKETAKGCAGVFTATNAVPCVAQVFEDEGSLGTLEAFLSLNGAAFYSLPTNHSTITLTRQHEPASFPACIGTTAGPVVVFDPGIDIYWTVA